MQFPTNILKTSEPEISHFCVTWTSELRDFKAFTDSFGKGQGFFLGRRASSPVAHFFRGDLTWKNEEANLFFLEGDTAVRMLILSGKNQDAIIHYDGEPIKHASLSLPPGDYPFTIQSRRSLVIRYKLKVSVRAQAQSMCNV